ncbi:MAG: response regulator transcription factor [Solirubrobacterales bacterium]|nr:response regulator transcription factor [Solirubrobacterales bacterium]
MKTRVGICEDDDALRQILRNALERADFAVRPTAAGVEAVRAFSTEPPQVLILDIGLPDADGRDVCQALRARGVDAPVLFLTARDAVTDRVSGFHAGGDDYLTKPFALSELVVRVQALARRAGTGPGPSTTPPSLEESIANGSGEGGAVPGSLGALLDPARHAVAGPDKTVRLTPTEYRLLAAVCASDSSVIRRAALVSAAWPDGAIVSDNTLDAYISRIRAKLRQAGRTEEIENVRGVGYTLK